MKAKKCIRNIRFAQRAIRRLKVINETKRNATFPSVLFVFRLRFDWLIQLHSCSLFFFNGSVDPH